MNFGSRFDYLGVWLGWHSPRLDWGISHTILGMAIGSLVVSLIAAALQNYRLSREVKRREKVEASLRDSEAHCRALICALPDLIMRVDRAGVYLEFFASPDFPMLGKPEHWVDTHVADSLPPDLAQKRMAAIHKALASQSVVTYEHILLVDGYPQIEQIRVIPYSPDEVLMLVQNISDRKRAEERLRNSEQRFRCAIAMAPLPTMLHTEDGEVLYINSRWTDLTGYTQKDIPTINAWVRLAYGKQNGDIFQNYIAQKPNPPICSDQDALTIRTANGSQRIWKFSSSPLEQLPDGRRVIISMAVDVTDSRQIETALKDSEKRYRTIYNQVSVGLVNTTLEGKFIDVNPRFCEMLGYSREELITKSVKDITHPNDRGQTQAIIQNLSANNPPHFFHEKRYLRKDGSWFWCSTGISVVRDAQGHPKQALAVIRDISDRIKIEEQLKHDAFHDGLTGLPNRSLLMERLELALKRTKRHPETQIAVLFLDLDNFKAVNDSLGHLVGDKLLLAIATRLKLVIRETDLAARLGGDEFVVLLEEIGNLSESVMVAKRILEVLQSPVSIADRELFPGVSIGVATSKQDHHYKASELLRDADIAMYWAKHNGRGQYVVFDSSMHLQAVARLQIENNLRKALENEEFSLYYQPIVNLKTQRIESFATMLRWHHPEKGLLLPQQFIDVAREIGLVSPINEWILRTAAQQLVSWQALVPKHSFGLYITLLGEHLKESLLIKLEEILAIHSLAANSLMLEVTENMLMQDFEITQGLPKRLKDLGIGVVINDFGIGYSCLRSLHQLPVQALKIDQSLISPTELNEVDQIIAKSIITLCQSLELMTIAEGIKTRQQLHWLKKNGCDAAQGEYFSAPVSVEDASHLLSQKKSQD